MKSSTVASLPSLLLLLPGLLAAGPLPTQEEGELAALVASEAQAAAGRKLEELWVRAVELRGAHILGGEGELDRLLDQELARPDLSPQAVLLFASSRLQGETPDVGRLADALAPLLDAGDPALALGATRVLGNRAFLALNAGRRNELSARLLERAQDGARSPAERLTYAKSAYSLGGGKERIRANKVLKSFLESQDPELRAQGALALAEIGDVIVEGELRRVLRALAQVPDERGKLAASYLEREELREENARRLKEMRARPLESLPPELREFAAVLQLIQDKHLEGGLPIASTERLVEAAIEGMLQYMDPHSNLLTPEVYAKFFQELDAEYGGIGAYVNEDPDDGLFTIVRPIYTGPAYRAGLMTDDKIVRIDDWQTLGHPVDDIIKRLKGKPGTEATLYIWRQGMDPELIERPTDDMKVVVTREAVRIPPGSYQLLPGGIGLLQLNTFSQVSMDEARKWIPEMLANGMKALVLDLRYNGGGLLTEAQEVAELFLPKGKEVVSTADRDGKGQRLPTRVEPVLPAEVPLVILTGRHTASAAEIVSGALQDHGRAKLVGKTTYGKGSVQQLLPILLETEDQWEDEDRDNIRDPWEKLTVDHDGDGEMDYAPRVKLTVAKYLLPSGRSINRELDREGNITSEGGIAPDPGLEIDPPLIERWRFEAQRKIRPEARAYVERYFPANRELFGRLAVNDQKKTELYPDFESFYAGLETELTPDDVRRVLRSAVRRRVQDDRGAEFPDGDFVEDVQLQKAIEVALEALGQTPDAIADYELVFDLPAQQPRGELALSGRGLELQRVRALVEQARTSGRELSREDLDQLLEILGTIDLGGKKN